MADNFLEKQYTEYLEKKAKQQSLNGKKGNSCNSKRFYTRPTGTGNVASSGFPSNSINS